MSPRSSSTFDFSEIAVSLTSLVSSAPQELSSDIRGNLLLFQLNQTAGIARIRHLENWYLLYHQYRKISTERVFYMFSTIFILWGLFIVGLLTRSSSAKISSTAITNTFITNSNIMDSYVIATRDLVNQGEELFFFSSCYFSLSTS